MTRSSPPKIHGILNILKPEGVTSRNIVDRIAKLVRPSKAGHAGTLDPLATGVLVVCVGDATRLVSDVQQQKKHYHAIFQLGCTSDTEDVTGKVTPTPQVIPPSMEEIRRLLPEFVGDILQVPPQYSAKQVQGKRAYALARTGQSIALPPVPIRIDAIELLDYSFPRLELAIQCGSGTYIRSIGRDLGERLGCGAVMTELTRTRIGVFDIETAIASNDLDLDIIRGALLPLTSAVPDLPTITCRHEELHLVSQGKRMVPPEDWPHPKGDRVAMLTPEGMLAAVAEWKPEEGQLAPRMVFWKPESSTADQNQNEVS